MNDFRENLTNAEETLKLKEKEIDSICQKANEILFKLQK